jgi:hypothetical protein
MKKILLVFAILLIIIVGLRFTQSNLGSSRVSLFRKSPTITINNQVFKVATATTSKDQQIGLSETKSLPQDQGMIFLFKSPGFYSFWMKNMKFPIDIIYIDNNTIITIVNSAPIPKNPSDNLTIYTPSKLSDKVLEINAGLSKKYNFKNGDKIKIDGI